MVSLGDDGAAVLLLLLLPLMLVLCGIVQFNNRNIGMTPMMTADMFVTIINKNMIVVVVLVATTSSYGQDEHDEHDWGHDDRHRFSYR